VSGGAADQASSVRRIAQIPHEAGSIVDGALSDVAKSPRVGGPEDKAARLGEGREAHEARNPGHGRHSATPAVRTSTRIAARRQWALPSSHGIALLRRAAHPSTAGRRGATTPLANRPIFIESTMTTTMTMLSRPMGCTGLAGSPGSKPSMEPARSPLGMTTRVQTTVRSGRHVVMTVVHPTVGHDGGLGQNGRQAPNQKAPGGFPRASFVL